MALPILHIPDGRKPWPEQALPGGLGLGLARGRVHEICGPARATLAALILGESQGPVLWISPGWLPERIYPAGLAELADPGRIIFARVRRPEDLQWAMEEALRSGAVPLVLADLPAPPALTPVRRLHLAAETGAEAARHTGRLPPLGLLLTPESGGAQGVESRWLMAPAPSGSTLIERRSAWLLHRLRARLAPEATFHLRREAAEAMSPARVVAEVWRSNSAT
ncbi:MAG: ImuA family protein [Cypionkella sp.]